MDLTQLSRTEKDNNLLQKLPENFYEVAKEEIAIQEQEASLAESDIEQMILQENVTTERRAYQNLRTIRIKKILKIAALDAYPMSRSTRTTSCKNANGCYIIT